MAAVAETAAAILAGGNSGRMGRDKITAPFGEGCFLTQEAEALAEFPQRYLAGGWGEGWELPGWQLVADQYPGCGPLAGVQATLAACTGRWLVACSCDLPVLGARLPRLLVAEAQPPYQAVVPVDPAGQVHPLCAIYAKELEPVTRALLEAGQYRMAGLLDRAKVRYLPVSGGLGLMLTNVNSPLDYRILLANSAQLPLDQLFWPKTEDGGESDV